MFIKIKAGALQLTVFITVIIALLLSAFLLYIHTYQQFQVQHQITQDVIKETDRAVEKSLRSNLNLNDTLIEDTRNMLSKKNKLSKSFWGIYDKIYAETSVKKKTFQKIALVGGIQNENRRTALYIANNYKPLVVVGETTIQGEAYLPEQGIRPGNIAGHSYYNTQLIYGSVHNSFELPQLPPEKLSYLRKLQHIEEYTDNQDFFQIENHQLENSFYHPTKLWFQQGTIELSAISLTGNIIVKSNSKITVDASCRLTDVILIAPKIEITSHVKGNFQAIATKSIIVHPEVKLSYPSSLILYPEREKSSKVTSNSQQEEPNQLKILEQVSLKGVIAYLGKYDPNNYYPQIYVEKESEIVGEVYCTNNLEHRGKVEGTVYTANFVAHQAGSIYQNHLYNAKILIDPLPEEYVGLDFENSTKEVAKWLY